MKTGKLLFLDMDGVMNSQDNMNAMAMLQRKLSEKLGCNFNDVPKGKDQIDEYNMHRYDERCLRWLEYIILKTGCDLVISSTWRYKGLEKFTEMWKGRNCPGTIVGVTPFGAYGISDETYGKEYHTTERGWDIQQFLNDLKNHTIPESFRIESIYDKNYTKYAILDDDTDMLEHQLPYFVQTSHRFGLDYRTALQVIAILGEK